MAKDKIFRFEGKEKSDEEFIIRFQAAVQEFMDIYDDHKSRTMYRLLWEISRNIYDHAYGWGYLRLTELEGGSLEFEIGNSEIPESEKSGLVKKRTRPSTGVGLGSDRKPGMIRGLAEYLEVAMTIDIPGGYIFRGVFKK